MLRDIPSILSPDLLWTLRSMGHGDMIVIADANFPAASLGIECLRLDGLPATQVLEAVLRVLPLDTYGHDPALVMEVVGDADAVPPVVTQFQQIVDSVADHPAQLVGLERFAFYRHAREASAIVQTGETRLYGNIILRAGVIDA